MERVQCCLCSCPPTPTVHHCHRNHMVCGKCSQVLGSSTKCPLENCGLETCPCSISSLLLSLMCPLKSIGYNMLPSKVDLDLHNSPNSMYTCPFCDRGEDFRDIQTLNLHLEGHNPIEVPIRENVNIKIGHGRQLLLKEQGSTTFFLLSFKDSCLMLNHMLWDERRTHSLAVRNWALTGNTSDTHSSSVVQRLQLPLSFAPGEAITLTAWLDSAKSRVVVLKNLEENREWLECKLCCQIAAPSVYHCSHHTEKEDHQICLNCFEKLPRRNGRRRCEYCHKKVTRCRIASYILRNSQWYCSNQNMGCQRMMRIEGYEDHVNSCLKSRYYCPICSEGFDVLDSLMSHVATHPKVELEYLGVTRLTVGRGCYLLQMESTDEYYLLIFKENHICLQHMPWVKEQEYSIEFQDVGYEWHFGGETTEVEKIPRLSARFLTIPEAVLHPQSRRPIPIIVTIVP